MFDAHDPILKVSDLTTVFKTRTTEVHAVNGINFSLGSNEVLGVVGESGSGKSVAMLSLLGLLGDSGVRSISGSASYNGRDILKMSQSELRKLRGAEVGFILQDPMTSLNPVFTVGYQIMEPIRIHLGYSRAAARDRAAELLDLVGIADARKRLSDYPHQFSGGMRQRVMIAVALSCDPKILIADEPTTALDVTVQAQILDIVRNLQDQMKMSIIWITHDLGLLAGIADRVIVMYAGQIIEHGRTNDIFSRPCHPYTQALLAADPSRATERAGDLRTIPGQPLPMFERPKTCAFATRCDQVFNRCRVENPSRRIVDDGHDVACWWDARSREPYHGN